MKIEQWSINATFWGLNIYEAIREIALDEWEPQISLFDKKPGKSRKPKYHDACMNVYLIPSDKDGMVWLHATDGCVSVAMEVMGRCTSPVAIPKNALPPQGKKADSSGWEIEVEGIKAKATRLSKGYTGVVQKGETVEFEAPDVDGGWIDALEELRDMPHPTLYVKSSAKDIGRAFTALGARFDHSFYFPICTSVSENNKDVVAYSTDVHGRAVSRIATSRLINLEDECK